MQLRGQGAGVPGDRGFAMAALLVGLSVMAVLMSVALPVWSRQAQREREEEYLFRAFEYARGVMKFQQKAGPGTLPPSLDVLVQQRFVRRKYKDPLTGEDFQPVYQTVAAPGQPGIGASPGSATPGAIAATPTTTTSPTGTPTSSQGIPVPGAGIIGVVSKSKAASIKVFNGRTRYDQWAVTYQDIRPGKGLPPDILQALNAPGGVAPGGAPAQATPGNPFGQPGANPFGGTPAPGGRPFGQPGANPFGQPGANPFGQPGANPFAQPGANPFGQPGTNPFGQPGAGQVPPGAPGANPFGAGGSPGASPFSPAYPPPPKKQ
ncbi:MAG: hypothetical protein R2745_03395 [Vicinamibacterales bacterium]